MTGVIRETQQSFSAVARSAPARVMFFLEHCEPGGAQSAMSQVSRAFRATGRPVATVYGSGRRNSRHYGKGQRTGRWFFYPVPIPNPLAWWRARRAARAFGPDIVLSVNFGSGVFARMVVGYGTPILVMSHTRVNRGALLHGVLRLFALRRIVALTEHHRDIIQRRTGLEPTAVIPNAVAPLSDEMEADVTARKYRDNANSSAPDDIIHILFVGRLVAGKGLDRFLGAVQALVKDRRFVLATVVGDGSLRSRYQQAARQMGIDHCVRFVGVRSDIPQLMLDADMLVHPSSHELLPMVLLEAGRSGLPIVCSDIPGNRSVVDENTAVMVNGTNDGAAYARAIRSVASDGGAARYRAVRLREIIRERYSLSVLGEQYSALVDAICSPPESL